MTAYDIFRSLVQEIILTPGEDELLIDVRGDLAGILAISLNRKKPVTRAGSSQVEMVAGTSSDLNLRRSQVEVVASACSNLKVRTQKTARMGRLMFAIMDRNLRWLRGQDLNLRPSGYEPDELPGCSTPRQGVYYEPVGYFFRGFRVEWSVLY